MALAFGGLIYMQLNYVNTVYRFRNEQFDSRVRQALSAVSQDAERAEMARLISERFVLSPASSNFQWGGAAPRRQSSGTKLLIDTLRFGLDQLPQDPFKIGPADRSDRIQQASKQLLEAFNTRYDEVRTMVIELAMESVRDNSPIPIYDRISARDLELYLNHHITGNGIRIPYVYEVVDKNHRAHYSSGKVPEDNAYAVYTQVLFPNDNPSRMHFLRVYFPGKRQELSSSIDFLVPTLAFTVLLFVIFVITMVSLFRQKKLEELRKDFINNMTHELKTPVSTIMVATQMLGENDMDTSPERKQKWVSSILAEGQRLELLIDKVLQMSFFDQNRIKLKLKEIDMEEMVLNVTNIFSIKVEQLGGDIEVDLEAEEALVEGDEMHLTNIIFNLLDNAIKYRSPDRPPILKVGTSSDNNNIKIYIQDNGIGMKRDQVKNIFERFYRIPTGNRHDVKGYGLGLAYVRHMVKLHNGDIIAESDLGKGTKFIITLPLIKKE